MKLTSRATKFKPSTLQHRADAVSSHLRFASASLTADRMG